MLWTCVFIRDIYLAVHISVVIKMFALFLYEKDQADNVIVLLVCWWQQRSQKENSFFSGSDWI